MIVIDASIVQIANYYVLCKYHADQSDITAEKLANKVIEAVKALELSTGARSRKESTVMVMDRGRSWRLGLYDKYKYARVGNEHYAAIRPEAERLISEALLTFAIDGLEADDLAYLLTKNYANVAVISNDGDFKAMVRGHGHSWVKYSDKSVYRLPNDHSIAIDVATKANVEKMFLGCPTDAVPPVYKEANFERYAQCIKEMDIDYKEQFLKTGVIDDILTFMCMYNGINSAGEAALFDNYMLTGYSDVIYSIYCPEPFMQAQSWLSTNKENLAGLKKFEYF